MTHARKLYADWLCNWPHAVLVMLSRILRLGQSLSKMAKLSAGGGIKNSAARTRKSTPLRIAKSRGLTPKARQCSLRSNPAVTSAKHGPCTDALIAAKLKKIVVATIDPSKHANGKGIRQLRKAGIKVDVGLCEAEATGS